jgi:hypothetical protein
MCHVSRFFLFDVGRSMLDVGRSSFKNSMPGANAVALRTSIPELEQRAPCMIQREGGIAIVV